MRKLKVDIITQFDCEIEDDLYDKVMEGGKNLNILKSAANDVVNSVVKNCENINREDNKLKCISVSFFNEDSRLILGCNYPQNN